MYSVFLENVSEKFGSNGLIFNEKFPTSRYQTVYVSQPLVSKALFNTIMDILNLSERYKEKTFFGEMSSLFY